MVADGWMEETRRLIDGGYGADIERLKALGYREMAACLRGEQPLEAAVEATKQHHRRYAKRQMTWFNADKRVRWLDCAEPLDPDALAEQALALYYASGSC